MKIYIIIVFLFFIFIYTHAQEYSDPIERIYGKMRVDSLISEQNQQIKKGYLKEAIRTGGLLLEETNKLYGDLSYEFCTVAQKLAALFSSQRDFENAAMCAEIALVNLLEIDGQYNSTTAAILDNLSKYHGELGVYEKALSESALALELWEKIAGKESVDYAIALNNHANLLQSTGELSKAIEEFTVCLSIIEQKIGQTNDHYATFLDNLGISYSKFGDKEKSVKYHLEAYNIYKKLDNVDKWDLIIVLSNLQSHYMELRQYEAALIYIKEGLTYFDELSATDNELYAHFLYNQLICYSILNMNDEALLICEYLYKKHSLAVENIDLIYMTLLARCKTNEKLDIVIKGYLNKISKSEKEKISFGKQLIEIGNIYKIANNDIKAKKFFDKGEKLISKSKNKKDIFITYIDLFEDAYSSADYNNAYNWGVKIMGFEVNEIDKYLSLNTLKNICKVCDVLDHYKESIQYGQIWINKAKNDSNEDEIFNSYMWNATFNSHAGDYQQALLYAHICNNMLDNEVSNLSDINEKKATIYNNMGKYYLFLGDYSNAKQYIDKSLKYKEANSEDYAISLSLLGSYYAQLEDYSKTIQLDEQAILILDNCGRTYTHIYNTLLMNVGNTYAKIGNYDAALEYLFKAYESQCSLVGEKHSSSLLTQCNIAAVCASCGDYRTAAGIQGQALQIMKEIWGENNNYYIESLSNFALYFDHLNISGQEGRASDVERKVLRLQRENYGEKHPSLITTLFNMGSFCYNENNIIDAAQNTREALDLQHELFGYNNLSSLQILSNLIYIKLNSELEFDEKDKEDILNYTNLLIPILQSQFSNMREDIRNYYWITNSYLGELFCFICEEIKGSKVKRWCSEGAYNFLLARKGLLLNSSREFSKILEKEDNLLIENLNKIDSLYSTYRTLVISDEKDERLFTIKGEIRNLENKLVELSKKHGEFSNQMDFNYQTIISHLGQHDVAIEFVQYKGKKEAPKYAAIVVSPRDTIPQFIPLFEEKELKNLVEEDDKAGIYTNKAASKLVWGKLQSSLEGVENVYFAPDGILHQIAIEYLPDCDGDGMISDRYNLYRLSSTREIALNRHNAPTRDAVLYGGIKYDTDVKTMETESQKYEKPQNRGFNPYYNLTDSLSLRGSLDYLAGSLTEAENINDMMKENNYNITLLTDTIATEESFKNLSGKANGIIHISTHGFYWTESEAERKASHNDRLMFMSQLGENSRRNVEDKALTRTGLFMAGATHALKGDAIPEGVDDGILTAQEIANLDLRGLDLVVLSACQTGMGDISGDGVFGLQRGFKKAGANTILMSLWDVNDEATQILMTNFYKNYLDGMSKQQALREAQKTVRETPGFSDPKYWAAFILLDALN